MHPVEIVKTVHAMRGVAPALAASSLEARNQALDNIAEGLKNHAQAIFSANRADCSNAQAVGIAPTILHRLKYDEKRLQESLDQLEELKGLEDPIGRLEMERKLDDDLVLRRVSCPIGVLGVIFEARPDALIQIGSLCLKSGNVAILKGGSEAKRTNEALFEIVHDAYVSAGLPELSLSLAQTHAEIDELLACDKDVDLLIPRGSNAFVRYIMDHTKIPVMGHAEGVCHIYVHKDADPKRAISIVVDSKTQYPAVCNAAETLLIDRAVAPELLPKIAQALAQRGARLRGTQEVVHLLKRTPDIPAVELMGDNEFHTEYGDLVMSCKIVENIEEAVQHINRWSSHHTDAIVTEDECAAQFFMRFVDSADVYHNCSTRFADGFRYGFGAEVGIATGKLQARGPVGLEGLESYKYLLEGNGNIVASYASGKRRFHFKDIKPLY